MASAEREEQPVATDRRSFLKGTVAVAAVAAGGVVVSQAAAQPGGGKGRKLSGVVHVLFDPKKKPTRKDVDQVLERIYKLSGCSKCGLGGIDLRLALGDPEPLKEFREAKVIMEAGGR